MNQQPDKLFRDKLEGYQQPAPTIAWEKIAAAQHKSSKKIVWTKIAASLMLFSVAAYHMWPNTENMEMKQAILVEAAKELPNAAPAPQNSRDQQGFPDGNVQHLPMMEHEKSSARSTTIQTDQKQKVTRVKVANPEIVDLVAAQDTTPAPEAGTPAESHETVAFVPAFQNTPATQNITLVFTAKEVNDYLDQKGLGDATSDEKKPSTLMKLLKRANDLTKNRDPLGELRQKKNEILALNFKSEKQRGQNK